MKQKKIVTIGGGTGAFMLLCGLKKYPVDITAIVSMVDDGGSTGVLRDELGVLPPGDVRQCLVALSDESEMMRELMNYRFDGGELKGHSFGNLLLSALEKISGSFADGVKEASRILRVRGRVVPVSEQDMRLKIYLNDGTVLNGEKELDENKRIFTKGIRRVALAKKVTAHKHAVAAIKNADIIVIGPGDHYGNTMPNILVDEIARAIKRSKAKVVYNCNTTNKKGHTDKWTLDDYIKRIEKCIGNGRIDYVTFNTRKPEKALLVRYEKVEGKNSLIELESCDDSNVGKSEKSYDVLRGDFLYRKKVRIDPSDAIGHTRAFIRHDGDKLAKAITAIIKI